MPATTSASSSRVGLRPGDQVPAVLALQGSSEPHVECFRRLGYAPRTVRRVADLDGVTHLVMPGGESTTIHHLLELFDLWDPLRRRAGEGSLAIFGTCAGAILLGRSTDGERPPRMDVLDATVDRNAYGTQLDSFTADLTVDGLSAPFHAVFIRAPIIRSVGADVRVLATQEDHPVLVRQRNLLAATFHPELTEDTRVHELFLGPS